MAFLSEGLSHSLVLVQISVQDVKGRTTPYAAICHTVIYLLQKNSRKLKSLAF